MPNKIKQKMGSKVRQARFEAGLCIRCGKKRELKRFCRACADIENIRVQKYKAKNRKTLRERWHTYYAGKGKEVKQLYYLNNREHLIRAAAGYKQTQTPLKTRYPYFTDELLTHINGLVPQFADDLRSDICQELALLVISGEIQEKDLPAYLPSVIKSQRKFMPDKFQIQMDVLEEWQISKLEKRFSTNESA